MRSKIGTAHEAITEKFCSLMKPSPFTKIIEKMKMIRREEGLAAVFLYCVEHLIAKTGWYHDKYFFGRWVEWRGDIVHIDGCTFRVDSPLIVTALKSRFIRDQFEKEERIAVKKYLDSSLPLIELGASIGIVSCVANKKLANPETHVVVEANPELIPILRVNRELNGCLFAIVNKALGYGGSEAVFYKHERFSSGGLKRPTDSPIRVPTVTLAEIIDTHRFERANLICDIEGGEIDLVSQEKELISKKIFQIIFDLHPSVVGAEAIRRMRGELEAAGFRKLPIGRWCNILVLQNSALGNPARR